MIYHRFTQSQCGEANWPTHTWKEYYMNLISIAFLCFVIMRRSQLTHSQIMTKITTVFPWFDFLTDVSISGLGANNGPCRFCHKFDCLLNCPDCQNLINCLLSECLIVICQHTLQNCLRMGIKPLRLIDYWAIFCSFGFSFRKNSIILSRFLGPSTQWGWDWIQNHDGT